MSLAGSQTHLLGFRSITITETRELGYGNQSPFAFIVKKWLNLGFDRLVQLFVVFLYHRTLGYVEQQTTA